MIQIFKMEHEELVYLVRLYIFQCKNKLFKWEKMGRLSTSLRFHGQSVQHTTYILGIKPILKFYSSFNTFQ